MAVAEAILAARARRAEATTARAALARKRADASNDEWEKHVTSNDMRDIWNSAAFDVTGDRELQADFTSKVDQSQAKRRLVSLLGTCDIDTPPGEFLQAFFEWVIKEWPSMSARNGTSWMHKRDMLPRHPDMHFVVHHWKHFRRAYADRQRERSLDYLAPELDERDEEIGRLKQQLVEKDRFDGRETIQRQRDEIRELKARNHTLSAQVAPTVDLDEDLPEWKEEDHD